MKKYKTGSCRWRVEPEIKEVNVERESESFVWFNGRRTAKQSDDHVYHDSWEAAHRFLREKADDAVDDLNIKIDKACRDKERVYAMEKPK